MKTINTLLLSAAMTVAFSWVGVSAEEATGERGPASVASKGKPYPCGDDPQCPPNGGESKLEASVVKPGYDGLPGVVENCGPCAVKADPHQKPTVSNETLIQPAVPAGPTKTDAQGGKNKK